MALTNKQLVDLGFFHTTVTGHSYHKRIGNKLLTVYKAEVYYGGEKVRDLENVSFLEFRKWLAGFTQSKRRIENHEEKSTEV